MNRKYQKNDENTSIQLRPDAPRESHQDFVQRKVMRQWRVTASHAKIIAELQGYGKDGI